MIFTEQYIKMVDCPEIQDGKKPEGALVCIESMSEGGIDFYIDDETGKWWWVRSNSFRGPRYLPSQQDLQGMSKLSWWFFDRACSTCSEYIQETQNGELVQFGQPLTKLEAGIQVVMHGLHHKKWNGNEWVAESSNPNIPNKVAGNETGNEVERREG